MVSTTQILKSKIGNLFYGNESCAASKWKRSLAIFSCFANFKQHLPGKCILIFYCDNETRKTTTKISVFLGDNFILTFAMICADFVPLCWSGMRVFLKYTVHLKMLKKLEIQDNSFAPPFRVILCWKSECMFDNVWWCLTFTWFYMQWNLTTFTTIYDRWRYFSTVICKRCSKSKYLLWNTWICWRNDKKVSWKKKI